MAAKKDDMAINKQHICEPGIYFITITNYNWLSLFDITEAYDLIYKWFDVMVEKGNTIIGYVIMPNHLHALIGYTQTDKSINTIVGNGKRFIAYDVVARLARVGRKDILKILSDGVSDGERKKGKLHEVFQPTFDCKHCYSYKFVNQKLDYIHSNPVSKKWSLTKDPADYKHSSAQYYMTGKKGVYGVTHANDWITENWNKPMA